MGRILNLYINSYGKAYERAKMETPEKRAV